MYSKSEQAQIRHKLKIFAAAEQCSSITNTCRHFGISRDTYHRWKRQYLAHGEKGLINSKPCPQNPKIRIPLEIEENSLSQKKLSLRSAEYRLALMALAWHKSITWWS